jgi:hypothetical protein
MEQKQTGVKWLIEEMHKNSRWIPFLVQERALQIEKQNIIDAILDNRNITSQITYLDAEKYFNENFGGETTVLDRITKEQYFSAINTVNAYNRQVTEEFEEMKKNLPEKLLKPLVPVTKDTIFRDVPATRHQSKTISVILQEWCYRGRWRDIIPVENRRDITLEHISLIKKSDILALTNIGKKCVDWLEKTLYEAGLTLKD